jgi:DNA-binding transcriptional MerR regulator
MTGKTEDEWLSVSDISEKVGIPVETIRRYIRSHGVHMKVKKIHKRYVVHGESLTVFKQIRELYADGKNVEEIEQTLTNRGVPMTVTVQLDDDEPMTVDVADELKRMNDNFEGKYQEQAEQIKLLAELVKKQQAYIDEKLEKQEQRSEQRHQVLVESLKTSMELRKSLIEAAATKVEEEPKKGFWARLFGK